MFVCVAGVLASKDFSVMVSSVGSFIHIVRIIIYGLIYIHKVY